MKLYKTKSKMLGYKIGLNNDHVYVAVAKKYFDGPKMDGVVKIMCEDIERTVIADEKDTEITFKDKYHPNSNYTLYYFKLKD